jgi:hypothetical protein
MRHLVAYLFWNKQDMIPLAMAGIANTYDKDKDYIVFILDGCTDDSENVFLHSKKNILKYWDVDYIVSETESYEWNHTANVQELCVNGGYDSLHFFHDDTLLTGSRFRSDVEEQMKNYGDTLGVIGGREGFVQRYTNGYGSYWSKLSYNINRDAYDAKIPEGNIGTILHPGEVAKVVLVNNGPIVYPKSTLKKVGYIDTDFTFFYAEEDYCFRCHEQGLTNLVVGTEAIHVKLGRVTPSRIYSGNIAERDARLLKEKWEKRTKTI